MTRLQFKTYKELADDHEKWLNDPKPFNCACCKKRHCDKNGKVTPETPKIAKQWEKCCAENICPNCGHKTFASFWLRGDAIECSDCR